MTDDEYAVYAAWLRHHFQKQPERLFLADLTFRFDPIGERDCDARRLLQNATIDRAMLEHLHDLGDAEYPVMINKFLCPKFRIPWKFEESDTMFRKPGPPFCLIRFSRVAFIRDHTRGLFAFSMVHTGNVGGGGPVLAVKRNSGWEFEGNLGCIWIS